MEEKLGVKLRKVILNFCCETDDFGVENKAIPLKVIFRKFNVLN